MDTRAWTEIENAEMSDVGRIALIGGNTLAIEDTVEQCLATALGCGMETLEDGELRPMTMADIESGRGCEVVEVV